MGSVEPRELDFKELSISNPINNISQVPFRPRDSYGWVPIIATHNDYDVGFVSNIDWRSMSLQYSEPAYIFSNQTRLTNEYFNLKFSFTDFRCVK